LCIRVDCILILQHPDPRSPLPCYECCASYKYPIEKSCRQILGSSSARLNAKAVSRFVTDTPLANAGRVPRHSTSTSMRCHLIGCLSAETRKATCVAGKQSKPQLSSRQDPFAIRSTVSVFRQPDDIVREERISDQQSCPQ
jgi:hypothetical protein